MVFLSDAPQNLHQGVQRGHPEPPGAQVCAEQLTTEISIFI